MLQKRAINVPAVSGLLLVLFLASLYVVTDLGQITALGETYPGATDGTDPATAAPASITTLAATTTVAAVATVVPGAPAGDPLKDLGTMVWAPPPSSPYAPLARPTISLKVFRNQLTERNSPMAGEAEGMYRALFENGTDPAIFLGFIEHESSYGQQIPAAHNPFGMMCHLQAYDCAFAGRWWQTYPNWSEAAKDWNDLMHYYHDKFGLVDLEKVIAKYAPPSDGNNDTAYVGAVKALADKLRGKAQA